MASRVLDYEYLPDRPENPVMESTLHAAWGHLLYGALAHTLADTGALVTGNVRFDADADGPRTAPDIMVVPGKAGEHFGVYAPGPDGPPPSASIEILSPSNTEAQIERRVRRMLELGVGEVYVLDPVAHTVDRASFDGDRVTFRDACGEPSEALGVTFARSGGQLAVCCPAGLVVRPGDDPYGWIVLERGRADAAARQADREREATEAERQKAEAERRKAEAERQTAEAERRKAETERLRAERYAAKLRAAGIEPDD